MAWDEWERLKSAAAERGSERMQIDHLAPDGGGGGGDLVVRQDDLGAVGHDAKLLFEGLRKQTDIEGAGAGTSGSGSTAQAAAALKSHSFVTGAALETTVRVWTSQADSVLQACAHISNHLDYSQKRHAEDDAQIGTVMQDTDGLPVSVSKLNGYFK